MEDIYDGYLSIFQSYVLLNIIGIDSWDRVSINYVDGLIVSPSFHDPSTIHPSKHPRLVTLLFPLHARALFG